ncbi:MAG: VWA domain-containing protein [Anaerolineae bacterium]|nr:VWA domain-containing protein [Anaerolineae bacterium]
MTINEANSSGQLLHNLVLFNRLLRELGLDVNPGRVIDLVQALSLVEIGRKPDFYYTLQSLLVHNKEDLPLFDQAFELFWRRPVHELSLADLFRRELPRPQEPIIKPPDLQPEAPQEKANQEEEDGGELLEVIEVTQTYSTQEILRQKDFADLSADELAAVQRMMAAMMWQMGERRTRRTQTGYGQNLDLRRLLRRNLRYGGELLEWPTREPKYKPRPLVILADISGSMERYTRLLLHFIYSLAAGLEQTVEAFVFSTRLTRITRPLRDKEIDRALHNVSALVHDWSGGTRIGEAIKSFNYDWGRRVLGRGAVVLIISDGWDRGDPAVLKKEMDRLHRSCHRLIWLNPLLGSAQYEPLTRGIMAALPYMDDFLPVHNLSSLEDLAQHLTQLADDKPRARRKPITTRGAAFIKPGR